MLEGQYVVFDIGQEEYAVQISQVKEIINYTIPTRVPSETNEILGVINLRDKVLSIIDLGEVIKVESKKKLSDKKIIIIENSDGAFGTIVDEVEEVIRISENNIDKSNNDICADNKYILGIAKKDNRLIILIDLTLFWEEVSK